MPSNRPLKMAEWGISWERYRELQYFCLQYGQKKAEAEALLTLRISTPPPVTWTHGGREYGAYLPRGGMGPGDPVAQLAAKRDRLLEDVRLIERAAAQAVLDEGLGEALTPYLLRAVTTKNGVQAVFRARKGHRPPCGERQFYALRRRFFAVLDGMKP